MFIRSYSQSISKTELCFPKADGISHDMLTPEQCRAARAILDWTQVDLAQRTKISDVTIRGFELEHSSLKDSTAQLLRLTFEAAGIEFLDSNGSGPGARLAVSRK